MDADHGDDLIVATPITGRRGNGTIRTFLAREGFGTSVSSLALHYPGETVRIGNFNADDVPDMIAYQAGRSGQMVVTYGNTAQDGTFGADEIVDESFSVSTWFDLTDLNGDGLDDVLHAESERVIANPDVLRIPRWGHFCGSPSGRDRRGRRGGLPSIYDEGELLDPAGDHPLVADLRLYEFASLSVVGLA